MLLINKNSNYPLIFDVTSNGTGYFTEVAMNYYNRSPWLKNQDSLLLTYNTKPYFPKKDFYATTTVTDTAIAFIEPYNQYSLFYVSSLQCTSLATTRSPRRY